MQLLKGQKADVTKGEASASWLSSLAGKLAEASSASMLRRFCCQSAAAASGMRILFFMAIH